MSMWVRAGRGDGQSLVDSDVLAMEAAGAVRADAGLAHVGALGDGDVDGLASVWLWPEFPERGRGVVAEDGALRAREQCFGLVRELG